MQQKYNYSQTSCQPFVLNGWIMLPAVIDDQRDTVIFDTGASPFLIRRSFYRDTIGKKIYHTKIQTNEQKEKALYTTFITRISNELWRHDNVLGMEVFVEDVDRCTKSFPNNAIVGLASVTLPGTPDQTLISFSNKTICYAPSYTTNTSDYRVIPSAFKKGKLYIYLKISGQDVPFIFDTGNNHGLILAAADRKQDPIFNLQPSLTLEGIMGEGYEGRSAISETRFYDGIDLQVDELKVRTWIMESPTFTDNNAGLEFIQHFDWIIDNKNKKVYAKLIGSPVFEMPAWLKDETYKAEIVNDRLQFIRKRKGDERFPLFKPILKVNGQKVTTENQCELAKYIDKVRDWDNEEVLFEEL